VSILAKKKYVELIPELESDEVKFYLIIEHQNSLYTRMIINNLSLQREYNRT